MGNVILPPEPGDTNMKRLPVEEQEPDDKWKGNTAMEFLWPYLPPYKGGEGSAP